MHRKLMKTRVSKTHSFTSGLHLSREWQIEGVFFTATIPRTTYESNTACYMQVSTSLPTRSSCLFEIWDTKTSYLLPGLCPCNRRRAEQAFMAFSFYAGVPLQRVATWPQSEHGLALGKRRWKRRLHVTAYNQLFERLRVDMGRH